MQLGFISLFCIQAGTIVLVLELEFIVYETILLFVTAAEAHSLDTVKMEIMLFIPYNTEEILHSDYFTKY